MKRIITMCLVTMLMLSIALAVYGEVGNTSTQIIYNVTDSYTFDIPPSVPVDGGMLEVKIYDKQSSDPVYVSFSSTNCFQYHSLCLINENGDRIYYIINNKTTNEVLSESVDGEFNIGSLRNNGSIILECQLVSSGLYPAGLYSDTLSFSFR